MSVNSTMQGLQNFQRHKQTVLNGFWKDGMETDGRNNTSNCHNTAKFNHYFLLFIVFAITCRITKMFSIHVNFLQLELIINCIKH